MKERVLEIFLLFYFILFATVILLSNHSVLLTIFVLVLVFV